MNIDEKLKIIEDIFTRGVASFIDPDGLFKEKLISKIKGEYSKDIIVKLGVDPTRPDLHLGHAVILRKLRQLQDLGCKIVFLVGDYTAQIGDPTGTSKVRPEIEQKEIEHNMKTYLDQVGKILQTEKKVFSWIRNSDWFTSITDLISPDGNTVNIEVGKEKISVDANSFAGKAVIFESTRMQKEITNKISVITIRTLLWSLKHITHSKLIQRDMFQERLKNREELYMHEMMYPVLQGIDSFVLSQVYGSCDLEVGGTDQTFNMLLGRDIMKMNKVSQQAVVSFEILSGTDGKEKMSKSLDNYIGITDEPNDMYGKVMSIPDSSIANYFELCTFTPMSEVEKIKKGIISGSVHPKEAKMNLAKQIVALYHGEKTAISAEENFLNTFSKKEIPENILKIKSKKGESVSELLVSNGVVKSKTEWRRLIEEGAVLNMKTNSKIKEEVVVLNEDLVLRIGKKRFVSFEL